MNIPLWILDPSLATRLTQALLHFLWQGCCGGLLVVVCGMLFRDASARFRYTLHVAALILLAACLPTTFWLVEVPVERVSQSLGLSNVHDPEPADPAVDKRQNSSVGRIDPVGRELTASQEHMAGSTAAPDAGQTPAKVVASGASSATLLSVGTLHSVSRWVATLYLLGVVLILGRLLRGVFGGCRLRKLAKVIDDAPLLQMVDRLARRLGLKVVPVVAWCGQISIPVVVGIVKPMILLPTTVVIGLTPDQLQALLLHELAHIRRFDPIVNLLQRIIEAVLFFHPVVWFVSRRISVMREHAADDMVLAAGWNRPLYADALLRAAELASAFSYPDPARHATVLGAAGTSPSEFKVRLLRLVEESPAPQLQLPRAGVLALLLVVAMGGILAWSQTTGHETASDRNNTSEEVAQSDKSPRVPAEAPVETSQKPEIPPNHFLVSFRETPWKDVFLWYGRVIGKQIELNVLPPGNFSYDSPRPLNHSEIIQVIKGELLRRGYCFAENGDQLSIQSSDVVARLYEKALRDEFMHGLKLRQGPDKFGAYFEIVDVRVVGATEPPAPSGPAIAYVLKANRDFSAQEATAFWRSCIFENSITSLKTGQPIVVDGFAVFHKGKWLGTNVPALEKGERIEIWQNEFEEWNVRPPSDLRVVIEGRIVGQGGKPVAGRIRQFLMESVPEGADEDLSGFLNWAYGGELIVDKQGEYQVTLRHGTQFVRTAYLYSIAPGYAPQRVGPIAVGYEKPAAPLTIELQPGFTGRLRLMRADGKPLEEGEVEVLAQDDLQADGLRLATLPIDGKPIAVRHCPSGPLLLKVRVPGFAEQVIRDVRLAADQVTDVMVRSHPKLSTGSVEFDLGRPE